MLLMLAEALVREAWTLAVGSPLAFVLAMTSIMLKIVFVARVLSRFDGRGRIAGQP